MARARTRGADLVAAADVPQAATRLGRIRTTVAALARTGGTSESVASRGRMERRHALYQLAAARALGWATRSGARRHAITERGRALLATAPGSAEESEAFADAVRESALVTKLAGGIDPRARDAEARIAARIERLTDPPLAPETARERARTLAAWLRIATSPQRALRAR